MNPLHICLVQADLVWEEPHTNRNKFDRFLGELTQPVDLIVLPEMFTTGFSMNPTPFAEQMDGESVQWMKEKAAQYDAVITGSIMIREADRYYNRLLWVTPQGLVSHYDKRHLFTMAGEDKHYRAGQERLVFEFKNWRICPQICYDLRFPVWSRNVDSYDLLLYVANWPNRRISDWDILLRARAIENQAYVVAVNRCGTDGVGLDYSGHSSIIDPGCRGVVYTNTDGEGIYQYTLDMDHLLQVRQSLPFLSDRDLFEIR